MATIQTRRNRRARGPWPLAGLFGAGLALAGLGAIALAAPPSAAQGGGRTLPFVIEGTPDAVPIRLDVRHVFPREFTANLSLARAHRLSQLGFELRRVKLYHLAPPPGACSPWPSCRNDDDDDGGGDTQRATPDDPTPWGIETVYDDPGITSTSGGAGVKAAILDGGVDTDHPDLTRRLDQCVDFTRGRWPKTGSCQDEDGHGTHVAGTVLADGGSDGLGIYGVAPDADLLAYKVCSSGCWTDDIAAAIDYAGDHGAHIVSMSLGGDSESSLIADAIDRNPELLYVAAAGNDGSKEGSIDYPGANAKVIAAGALDSALDVPSWSSRGVNDGDFVIEEREVEFGTPGVRVESTWHDGTYSYISGTSTATPHVTGLAAVLWQGDAPSTRSYLQSLAEDVWTSGDDPATGLGLPHL